MRHKFQYSSNLQSEFTFSETEQYLRSASSWQADGITTTTIHDFAIRAANYRCQTSHSDDRVGTNHQTLIYWKTLRETLGQAWLLIDGDRSVLCGVLNVSDPARTFKNSSSESCLREICNTNSWDALCWFLFEKVKAKHKRRFMPIPTAKVLTTEVS